MNTDLAAPLKSEGSLLTKRVAPQNSVYCFDGSRPLIDMSSQYLMGTCSDRTSFPLWRRRQVASSCKGDRKENSTEEEEREVMLIGRNENSPFELPADVILDTWCSEDSWLLSEASDFVS